MSILAGEGVGRYSRLEQWNSGGVGLGLGARTSYRVIPNANTETPSCSCRGNFRSRSVERKLGEGRKLEHNIGWRKAINKLELEQASTQAIGGLF